MTVLHVAEKYEYSKKDLIGHGAFAVVFKGRQKQVREHFTLVKKKTKKEQKKYYVKRANMFDIELE